MIDPEHELPVTRQVELLDLSRSSVYYLPRPISDKDLELMRLIDQLHLEYPFAGTRMLRDMLWHKGHYVGRRHVRTLMQRMGIEALYRRPRTTKPGAGHQIYPYLLRGISVDRPNQAWAMDITYIPMAKGFVYLAAVVDWFSRRVLSWRVSITMTTDFCLEALQEACDLFGKPQIFNTDQGSQFTSQAFTQVLNEKNIQISMDGKGSWRDNVFVERLWRSVKYEEVYLHAYDSVSAVKAGLSKYFDFYNHRRPHSKLDRMTPAKHYENALSLPMAA
jgi:putative transposase